MHEFKWRSGGEPSGVGQYETYRKPVYTVQNIYKRLIYSTTRAVGFWEIGRPLYMTFSVVFLKNWYMT